MSSGIAFNQVIRLVSKSDLDAEIAAFLIDRQARNLSPNTIIYYRKELHSLSTYMQDVLDIHEVLDVTSHHLRRYILDLQSHRSPGGVHCAFRAMKAFFNWFEDEAEPGDWRNPVLKVKAPKVHQEPLTPLSLPDLQAMLATCPRSTYGDRDRAALLCLLDTGCRAGEFVALNVGDVHLAEGQVLIREGKGHKVRTVFLGARSRKELSRYLRHRRDRAKPADSLWLSQDGRRLSYAGLREIVRRAAKRAGVSCPALHDFRRAFALACLRNGVDLVSLQRLMGHEDLTILRRYLKQSNDDLLEAHRKGSPVDGLMN